MNAEQSMVFSFYWSMRLPVRGYPEVPTPREALLRVRLMQEELAELTKALSLEDLVGIADGLADLLYVVYGTAVQLGIDIGPVFAEVHRSNMTKAGRIDAGGKVIKNPDYSPADVRGVLARQFSVAKEEKP